MTKQKKTLDSNLIINSTLKRSPQVKQVQRRVTISLVLLSLMDCFRVRAPFNTRQTIIFYSHLR